MPTLDPNLPLVALDTNVYISGTTTSASPPGIIINAWQENKINLALSEPIVSEIRAVFSRPYFVQHIGWSNNQLDQYITNLKLNALIVPGTTPVGVCRDPKDDMVFSCAIEAEADYIVSGDRDVLVVGEFQGIPIKSPRDFVEGVLEATR